MKKITKSFSDEKMAFIGKNLRYYRKLRGLSQESLGSLLNLHQSAISRIEDGKQNLTVPEMVWACDQLGIALRELCLKKNPSPSSLSYS